MSVLKRNMFNRGGFAHRGTGITSGLAPIKGYKTGGVSKREAYTPAWMSLFGGMMSGKSLQGGWGGAFDILGQATQQSAPLFAQAAQTMAAAHEDDDKFPQFKVVGNKLVKINEDGTTEVVQEYEKPEKDTFILKPGEQLVEKTKEGEIKKLWQSDYLKKNQKTHILAPGHILYDNDGNEIARGQDKKDTALKVLQPGEKLYDGEGNMLAHYTDPNAKIIKLNPGQRAYDEDGDLLFAAPERSQAEQIIKLNPGQKAFTLNDEGEMVEMAHYEDPNAPIIKLSPGQTAFDRSGNELFSVPATATKEQIYKLSPGQVAFDENNNPIASVPLAQEDQLVTVGPGSILYNKDTKEEIFRNDTNSPQQELIKLPPGTTLVDGNGKVVYTAPQADKYFELNPGQSVYNSNGELLFSAPSLEDNLNKYEDMTEQEVANEMLRDYEKRIQKGETLEEWEMKDYKRLKAQEDPIYKEEQKSWINWKAEKLGDITFIEEMDTRIKTAQALFEKNRATGPVRGRVYPIFGVFQDLTGINLADTFNKMFTEDRDFLTDPITAGELDRIRNELGVQFQDVMKGQVSNFEQRMILNSFFSVLRHPEANDLAFQNMIYLNDLRREMILIGERVDNVIDFSEEVAKWKKKNKPKFLNSAAEDLSNLEEEYGYPEGTFTER